MGDQENREIGNSSEKKAHDEDSAVASVVVDCQDPLLVFCPGVMMIVLDKLDVRSLAVSRLVSTNWLAVASSDQLWAPKCEELWKGKAHIPRISKVAGLSKMEATSLSIMDGKRIRITRDDLCDHAWDFHFTADALYNLRELEEEEEYWAPPVRRYFHEDGSITTGEGDKLLWDGNEVKFAIVATGEMRGQYVRIWCPNVCVEMENWGPLMSVIRNPDWSWHLSDNYYCYSSIPDANDKPGGTGPCEPQQL